ncbi:MAG: lysophospholipase L1-like esterase [Kangiellaceae bacterium]|jgi:lysophospholipase L1-like esterase
MIQILCYNHHNNTKGSFMLYKLFALLTLPILAVQGKQARKRALRLPEATGERKGAVNNPNYPALSILIIGDSAAAGVGVTHQDEALLGQLVANLKDQLNLSWQLVARTGAQTQDVISMLELSACSKPVDIVITSLGVNDVTSLQRSQHWLHEQDKLHQYCFEILGAKHIVVSGMPPVHSFPLLPQPLRWVMGCRAKQFDALQKSKIAKQVGKSYETLSLNLQTSAMAADGFHPGVHAYKEWAKAMSQRILQLKTTM